MGLYLGIDAGGTKTMYTMCDDKGNILVQDKTTTIHLKQVSEDEVKEKLYSTVDSMLTKLGSKKDDIQYVFAGVPGYGEFPEVITTFNKLFEEYLGNKRSKLGNDSVAGWAGSQAGKPGVNLVLGTGAIAYGMDYKNNEERSSGWGPYCGDEASAYWLGRKAINLFGKESDGRVEKSELYRLIKDKYELENDFDFISKILNYDDNRAKIAEFSMVLSKAAELGDTEAIKIIEEASLEAAQAIKAVIKKLDFGKDDKIYISYSGGVFNMGSLITEKIENKILDDERIEVIDSILEPSRGACLMALRFSGIKITDEIIENLKG